MTTIKKALAKCGYCSGVGCVTSSGSTGSAAHSVWRNPCHPCNGTGYACGVATTEVERHLFAIVQATRALAGRDVPPGIVELYNNCLSAVLSTPTREQALARAEDVALSGRGGDDE